MANTKPVAISCGEPAGIGPEIAALAWTALKDEIPMMWIGDATHLPSDIPVRRVNDPEAALSCSDEGLPVLHRDFEAPRTPGTPIGSHARHVVEAIEIGAKLASSGQVSAVCTAPIHKAALIEGTDFPHPGHTEFLAALAGDVPVVMMLASPLLRVVPATIHIPLREVVNQLTPDLLDQTISVTIRGLQRDFGIARPRIAVAGLNPHAGEDGKIGTEEKDWITAFLKTYDPQDAEVIGPMSADTMFHAAARRTYDAAVCMYHDQALIPIKTLDFDGGVNVTLGLPFIRTSPDHGTAFDIAGQGTANPASMIAALRLAHDMAERRAG